MFIVLKFDHLLKYANKHKTKVANVNIELGFLYFNLKCQHAHNEEIHTTFKHPSTLDLVIVEIPQDKKRKFVKFAYVGHLLSRGRTITYFKGLKELFRCLRSSTLLKTTKVNLQVYV